MQPSDLYALVARSLMDHDYLTHLAAQRGRPGQPFEAEQLDRLAKFSAFILKVQHNALWEDLPNVRRVLLAAKLELRVFRHYLPIYATWTRRVAPSRITKTHQFSAFLSDYLLRSQDLPKCMADVLTHDHTIWSLTRDQNNSSSSINGFVRIRRHHVLPWHAMETLCEGSPPAVTDGYVLYWKAGVEATARTYEIDSLTALVLEAARCSCPISKIPNWVAKRSGVQLQRSTLNDVIAKCRAIRVLN